LTKSRFHIEIENYLKKHYTSIYTVLIEYEETIDLLQNYYFREHYIL